LALFCAVEPRLESSGDEKWTTRLTQKNHISRLGLLHHASAVGNFWEFLHETGVRAEFRQSISSFDCWFEQDESGGDPVSAGVSAVRQARSHPANA
jgi:hypothetical protein